MLLKEKVLKSGENNTWYGIVIEVCGRGFIAPGWLKLICSINISQSLFIVHFTKSFDYSTQRQTVQDGLSKVFVQDVAAALSWV